ncbi:MAG: nucleotidyltransferase family protein [Chloroflexota bacterium]|nr:nucleotidyltransferase family protein [Chloroflexota bacterium]MDE2839593.1 nucleotidyltransferase family protein [Chloroflexota bacterium]MDE2930146.1 nucleotidyltransferase family protein [Chloroflexota bacterium]
MIPTQEHVLRELYKIRAALQLFRVRRIGVFGSVARNSARVDSDIDIIVDFACEDETIANFFGLQDFLSDHFQRKVDVIPESGLKPFSRDLVMRDAVFLEDLDEPTTEVEAESTLSQA